MVKQRKKNTKKKGNGKGFKDAGEPAKKSLRTALIFNGGDKG